MIPRQKVELKGIALVGGDDLRTEDETFGFDDDDFGYCYPKEGASEHGEEPCREVVVGG